MTIRTTQRMRKAMAEVRQQLVERVELDRVAPYESGDEYPDQVQGRLRDHCRSVKAIEGLDIVVGSIPPDRNYDALRWSAVSAIKAARDAGMSEEDLDEFMRQQATVEGEI